MKTIKILAAALLISFVQLSCKQNNPDGYDVGAGSGDTETYDDRGAVESGGTNDHPGQNIGSTRDSTSVSGTPGEPSNN